MCCIPETDISVCRCITDGDDTIDDDDEFEQEFMSLHCTTVVQEGLIVCDCKHCITYSMCEHTIVAEVSVADVSDLPSPL